MTGGNRPPRRAEVTGAEGTRPGDPAGAVVRDGGFDAGADRDEPGMRRLRAAGAVDGVRRWQDWLRTHRRTVESSLHA
ncbi:hypothetical protein [Micromonospora purpureochromogenes]|uniref:Uncharacterized protein n=1 Tax=Micromonospora purpureochromogenes TaxID=47872 RepID=A0ABX2RFX5_9ACTN|nr:hypothetical protein [Micromonospora purpureochromogenes]NYF54269.1 hypothetical protein [Micromonospora purpureochromogenes]